MVHIKKKSLLSLRNILYIFTNRTTAAKEVSTRLMLSKNTIGKIGRKVKRLQVYRSEQVNHATKPQGLYIIFDWWRNIKKNWLQMCK